jgi:hypothetical protein
VCDCCLNTILLHKAAPMRSCTVYQCITISLQLDAFPNIWILGHAQGARMRVGQGYCCCLGDSCSCSCSQKRTCDAACHVCHPVYHLDVCGPSHPPGPPSSLACTLCPCPCPCCLRDVPASCPGRGMGSVACVERHQLSLMTLQSRRKVAGAVFEARWV